MRFLMEGSVKIVLGLVVGAGLYEALFVRIGPARLWVLLVAGGLVLLALATLREIRKD